MIQLKRGLHRDLSESSIVLESGQVAYETDTHKLKIGDGLLQYGTLPYVTFEGNYLPLIGGTMSGDIDMQTHSITYHARTIVPFVAENSLSSGGVYTALCKRDSTSASNEAQLVLDATGLASLQSVTTLGTYNISVSGNGISMHSPSIILSTQTFSLTTAGEADFNGSRLVQVGSCQEDSDAANKQYVDNEIQTINQSLSNLQSSIKDYVTEEGEVYITVSGIGNVRAYQRTYATNRVELWSKFQTSVNWNTQLLQSGWYYSDFIEVQLPFTIDIDNPTNTVIGSMDSTSFFCNADIYGDSVVHFRSVRGIQGQVNTVNINLYISAQLSN